MSDKNADSKRQVSTVNLQGQTPRTDEFYATGRYTIGNATYWPKSAQAFAEDLERELTTEREKVEALQEQLSKALQGASSWDYYIKEGANNGTKI